VPDNAALLEELTLASDDRRAELVCAAGEPDDILVALGDESERLAVVEVTRSLRASELVVNLADQVGKTRSQVRARRARGQALAYAGRFPEALAICQEAIQLGESGDQPIEAARARLACMHALGEMGRYDEAIVAGETAYQTFTAHEEPELAARADINLGVIHQNRDAPREALKHFRRARAALPEDAGQLPFFVENNSGEALLLLNDFTAAQQAFESAADIAESLEAPFALALAVGNLADLAARRGLPHKALLHFERARRCFENDQANSHHARLLTEQAEVFASMGMFAESVASYDAALPQLERQGLVAEQARALAGNGRVLARLGRWENATACLAQAAHLYEQLDQPRQRAMVDLSRADLFIERGQWALAEAALRAARRVLNQRPLDRAFVSATAARNAIAHRAVDQAETEIGNAFAAIEGFELPRLRSDLLHLRSRIQHARGQSAEAAESARQAVAAVERIRGNLQAERFRTALLGDCLNIYHDAATFALDAGAAELAYEMIEKARSRSLLDTTRGALDVVDIAGATDDERLLAGELRELRAEMSAMYSRLADMNVAGRDEAELTPVQDRLSAGEQRVGELEQRLASARGVAVLYAPPATLRQTQAALRPGEALLEYFFLSDSLVAMVVTASDVFVVRSLSDLEQVGEWARRLRFQIGRALRPDSGQRSLDRLVADAQRELIGIYEAILAPLEQHLRGTERLLIAAHGPLHGIPFVALWNGRRYLCDRFEIVQVLSGSLLVRSRSRATDVDETSSTALVLGIADDRAPRIEHEASSVAAAIPDCRLLVGAQATTAAFRDQAGAARWLHLACHGLFAAGRGGQPGVRLADRWLTLRDIYETPLRAEMVVLSGCETGRVNVDAGDEVIGLLRAFLAAGARTIICGLWLLDDKVSESVMVRMYNELMQSGDAPAALRAAQRHVRELAPHPAFWAPYLMVGSP
jgi:CHAT domain-containing protein/tetratricopeptide (TPR) repeat protein